MIVRKLFFLTLIVFLFSCDSDENDDSMISNSDYWEKTYGGYYSDYFRSVQQTADGGFIVAGYTASFGAGKNDGWLIKTDKNGNEQWNQTFGGLENDHINSFVQTM